VPLFFSGLLLSRGGEEGATIIILLGAGRIFEESTR
jgi:hypothetical protein